MLLTRGGNGAVRSLAATIHESQSSRTHGRGGGGEQQQESKGRELLGAKAGDKTREQTGSSN